MEKSKHEKESYLGYWVRAFLCTYLTNIRNLSFTFALGNKFKRIG